MRECSVCTTNNLFFIFSPYRYQLPQYHVHVTNYLLRATLFNGVLGGRDLFFGGGCEQLHENVTLVTLQGLRTLCIGLLKTRTHTVYGF